MSDRSTFDFRNICDENKLLDELSSSLQENNTKCTFIVSELALSKLIVNCLKTLRDFNITDVVIVIQQTTEEVNFKPSKKRKAESLLTKDLKLICLNLTI